MFLHRKALLIIFVLFAVSNLTYSQFSVKEDSTNIVYTQKDYFTFNDSVYASSIVFNNKLAYNSVKTGLISAGVGAAITFGAVYFSFAHNKSCDLGCAIALTMGPIIIGGVSFLAGTSISYFLNLDEAMITPNLKKSFKQIGFGLSIPAPLPIANTPGVSNGKFTFGISYRNLNTKAYLPNRISLLYGNGSVYYNYTSNAFENGNLSIYGEESTLSLEMVNVNYNKVLSFLYGVEIGVVSSNMHSVVLEKKDTPDPNGWNEYYVDIPYKKVTTTIVDLMFGVNANLFSWLSWDLIYKIGPFSAYKNLKPKNADTPFITNKLITSLSVCF